MFGRLWRKSEEERMAEEVADPSGAHARRAARELAEAEAMSDAEFDAYIAFSETEAGQALNRALLEGFDVMYEGVSVELGRAAASRIVGLDL